MSRSRSFALMLVVAVLVWSRTARAVCSSRPLAAADGDARGDDEPCAAGGAIAAAGSGEASSGRREIWNRRSLGDRSPWSSPPSPLWNTPRTMPARPRRRRWCDVGAGPLLLRACDLPDSESFPSCVA